MNITIAELARAVGKSENYVRQHVHRKHLTARKDGRNVSVALDEAVRWARKRGLSFDAPACAPATTGRVKNRTARMTVLVWHAPGAQPRNLFTLIRHRRQDAMGPWAGEPDETWRGHDLGPELRLWSFDAPFERCRALVDCVLDSGTQEIGGLEVLYALEATPRRHWAYRDDRPLADASMRSPFSKHSAEVVEYWSFMTEPRQHWLKVLDSLQGKARAGLARLGFPLDRRPDRIGNLMIAGAEDAITCDLKWHHDQTLRFRAGAGADELLPGAYRAAVWASHSGDEVLRREIPATACQTAIEIASDVDHIGFAAYRNADGQCVDLMEVFLLKEIGIRMEIESGPTHNLQDRRGRMIHSVNPSVSISTLEINSDDDKSELDKGIRRQWLDRQIHDREAAARQEGKLWRFGPDEFDQAVEHLIHLMRLDADQEEPLYLADPYFMDYLKDDEGRRLYLDMFTATTRRPLRILCAKLKNGDARSWWSNYPNHLTSHVRVRAFLKHERHERHDQQGRPGFHDRYLITPRREVIITHSINGWRKDGVTFVRAPYGVYRAETERRWSMKVESPTEPLFVQEIT